MEGSRELAVDCSPESTESGRDPSTELGRDPSLLLESAQADAGSALACGSGELGLLAEREWRGELNGELFLVEEGVSRGEFRGELRGELRGEPRGDPRGDPHHS